ncbi:T9SS type A sorting domain-containing protein [Flavobacterium piscinae]|uniref:T9SS type A sorting domain-containing protein n=1 Tax=Flavobacterium piscinae TaxID=2506424 RepID=UPI0019CF284A|nr:T9SS type A sorting domain-containing protein [Flavobacterium piscinae]MBC8884134.1 T9SS type A sorting domain-containing protein [Flavobacterium piscinae]
MSLESINELNNCYTLIKDGKLYIENLKNVESLEINIFDLTGKKIFHENNNIIDNSTSVNIEDLKNGVYIINLSDKNGNYHSMKFLI